MDTVTLTFTVPEEHRSTLNHELELLLDSMEHLLAWLERRGGQWSMEPASRWPRPTQHGSH